MDLIKNFKSSLFEAENPASLGLFRILIGIVLFVQVFWWVKTDFISVHLFEPTLHFKFYYFQFLEPLSKPLMKTLMLLMLASTVFITIGKYFKQSCIFFGIAFTYIWLLDKSYFNNHYYFISLLIFLLIFSNADKWGSFKNKSAGGKIPYWKIFTLKFQIFIAFFIAGINKLTGYWLVDFQPMQHILETKASLNNYDWLATDFWFAFFSWGGLSFDLLIGFLIWSNKTRKIAIVFYILFNLMNFWLFYDIGEIGIFPFLLMACLALFIDPEKINQKLSWLNKKQKPEQEESKTPYSKLILIGIVCFITLQIAIPFRHLLYNNHVDWSSKGQRFSWRMKIMYKVPDIHFYLSEAGTNQKAEINIGNFLTSKQYTNLIYFTDFIPTVATYIKEEGIRRGVKNPVVTANFNIGFMGGEMKPLVDPNQDLTKIDWKPFENSKWILPLN